MNTLKLFLILVLLIIILQINAVYFPIKYFLLFSLMRFACIANKPPAQRRCMRDLAYRIQKSTLLFNHWQAMHTIN